MSNGPDWGQLVAQGRCKSVGVAWSEEEYRALRELKIPLEYVRGGCTTLEAYEKATGQDKKTQYMKKEDLLAKAKELGVEISEGAGISRADLILLIEEKEKSKKPEEVSQAA